MAASQTSKDFGRPCYSTSSQTVVIFSDGACIGNPGRGGYGVVVLQGKSRTEVSGGFRRTTNNRMEIMAAIVGLELLAPRSTVMLYTDSKYLEAPISRGWAKKWRMKGWRTKKGRRINYDLWDRLIDLCNKHNVKFFWVRGHAGNRDNERCDFLAMLAANADNLPIDRGYEQPAPLVHPTEQLSLKF
jgi:ribonuclease HI